MLLSDTQINALIKEGVLFRTDGRPIDPSAVGPVSLDLTTKDFCSQQGSSSKVILNPGDSVFVETCECVKLPTDLAARVLLRNSRIRQGLTLDAPLYFPGHKTLLYFRVSNVSANAIELDCSKGIAQVVFEQVCDDVAHPYEGAFTDELSYKGMGSYQGKFDKDIKAFESSNRKELEATEKRIKDSVLGLMAFFAAIFTLVNVNAGVIGAQVSAPGVLAVNLSVVGCFSALVALIELVVGHGSKRESALTVALAIAVVAFIGAAVVTVLI